jgi:hypothetical protein
LRRFKCWALSVVSARVLWSFFGFLGDGKRVCNLRVRRGEVWGKNGGDGEEKEVR